MGNRIVDTIREVDQTFLLIFSIAAALFFIISLCMIVVLILYHHKRHPQAASFKDNAIAELVWIVVPSLIVLAMFVSGWRSYLALQTPPEGSMHVKVTARKWSWTFNYDNGRVSNILYVPVKRSVFLDMTSVDVLHSFYVPAFRIKRDTVPGMTTSLWFRSQNIGSFDAMCAEYCGLGHSKMHTKVVVLPQDEFDRWYEHGSAPKGGEDGKELYVKYGCNGCHPLGTFEGVGPPLEKTYGSKRVILTKKGEFSLFADENYLRRSILHPKEDVVKGYPPIMPSYDGQIQKEEMDELIVFLKSLAADKKQ